MSTLSFLAVPAGSVGIIAVEHHTLLLLELPGSGHPATTATPEAIVLAEEFLVIRIATERAIDKMLLGETHWLGSILLCNVAFEGRVSSEGPAGATAALVLHFVHVAVGEVINSDSIDNTDAGANTLLITDVVQRSEPVPVDIAETRHLVLEFAIFHVTKLVHPVGGGIVSSAGLRLGVKAIDNRLVIVEDCGAPLELANAVIVLVVIVGELDEFIVHVA